MRRMHVCRETYAVPDLSQGAGAGGRRIPRAGTSRCDNGDACGILLKKHLVYVGSGISAAACRGRGHGGAASVEKKHSSQRSRRDARIYGACSVRFCVKTGS